jgi:hypothetical protein
MTKIYRGLKKLNSPKINVPMKKWANELNRAFSKKEVQMAEKHMKDCLSSLAIKEMQIKIKKKDSTSHLLEWLPSRTQQTTKNNGEDVEKKNTHTLMVGM